MLDSKDSQEERIDRLIETQQRIATALEEISSALRKGLGGGQHPAYPDGDGLSDLITESEMAVLLDRNPRTLAKYRRAGKFPGCWIRNGRSTLWRKQPTLMAWREGLS